MSLRLEKNWGAWGLDFRPDFTAAESGLDAFIDWNKGDFIGRTAASAEREAGPKMRLVSLVIETDDIDVSNDEAIFHDGVCVGYVTSGGYAHHADKSIAMGYIPAGLVREDAQFGIEIMGEIRPARLQLTPLHDPIGGRMRG
jgi:dimethylglycine dehydrogenase